MKRGLVTIVLTIACILGVWDRSLATDRLLAFVNSAVTFGPEDWILTISATVLDPSLESTGLPLTLAQIAFFTEGGGFIGQGEMDVRIGRGSYDLSYTFHRFTIGLDAVIFTILVRDALDRHSRMLYPFGVIGAAPQIPRPSPVFHGGE